jgi:DNA processing protein
MTLDEAVALSLCPDLSRVGLTERLRAGDPHLHDIAGSLLERAKRLRALAMHNGIGALAWNHHAFPQALLQIPDAPPVLWHRGHLDSLREPAVAIVGSRAASAVALEIAARLAEGLAACGVVVVSGLARGVDSAAHDGALCTGRTVAILGSGVDRIYPREHDALAQRIAERGLVVSEYPPGTPPLAFHFPMRNRLISGLSRAVVVIEASEQSGSLITAACALEQGREVMVVPGSVLNGRNRGAHALIRDGATIVESAGDVLEALGWDRHGRRAGAASRSAVEVVSDPVLAVMQPGESYDLDRLAASTRCSGADLLARLLALELQGKVRRTADGGFMRPL